MTSPTMRENATHPPNANENWNTVQAVRPIGPNASSMMPM